MSPTTTSNLIQVLTTIAVLVGLGLVILELRQTKNLAMADLMMQQYTLGNDVDNTMLGENPMDSLVRDCMGDPLTPKDALVLNEFFWAVLDKADSYRAVLERADTDGDWRAYAKSTLRRILSTNGGRVWWDIARDEIGQEEGSEIVTIGDEVLSELGATSCSALVQKYVGSRP
jgi:hypothetical protein